MAFDSAALDLVHATSAGVPRVINLMCDRALMFGARFGLRVITADIVAEAARALGLRPRVSRSMSWLQSPRWLAAAATALIVLGAIALYEPIRDITAVDLPTVSRPPSHPFAPPPLPTPAAP